MEYSTHLTLGINRYGAPSTATIVPSTAQASSSHSTVAIAWGFESPSLVLVIE